MYVLKLSAYPGEASRIVGKKLLLKPKFPVSCSHSPIEIVLVCYFLQVHNFSSGYLAHLIRYSIALPKVNPIASPIAPPHPEQRKYDRSYDDRFSGGDAIVPILVPHRSSVAPHDEHVKSEQSLQYRFQ